MSKYDLCRWLAVLTVFLWAQSGPAGKPTLKHLAPLGARGKTAVLSPAIAGSNEGWLDIDLSQAPQNRYGHSAVM